MRLDRYVISISVSDVSRSQVWDARKPLKLGYNLPWKVEKRKNVIYLRHDQGNAWEVSGDLIKKGKSIPLPKVDGNKVEKVKFHIREANSVHPAFEEDAADGDWKIFSCSGSWLLDSGNLEKSFTAKVDKKDIFSLTFNEEKATVVPFDESVIVGGQRFGDVEDSSREFHISKEELGNLSIQYEHRSWKFTRSNVLPLSEEDRKGGPAWLTKDTETGFFKKIFLGTLMSIFLAVGLTQVFVPAEVEEEKPTFTKIILKKRNQDKADFVAEESQKVAASGVPRAVAPAPTPVEPNKAAQAKKIVVQKKNLVKSSPIQSIKRPKPTKSRVHAADSGNLKKPVKKKVSKSVLAAKALQKSMAKFMKNGSKSLLANSKLAKKNLRGRAAASIFSGSAKSGSAGSPRVNIYAEQNAGVDISVGSGGGKKGHKEVDYKFGGTLGTKNVGGKGGEFLAVEIAEGTPTMAETGLTREEVNQVINRHLSEIRYCYEKAIVKTPDAEGTVVVEFKIGASGSVKTSTVKNSSITDKSLDGCVLTRLAKWKFPKPRGKIDVDVLYPFIFRRL